MNENGRRRQAGGRWPLRTRHGCRPGPVLGALLLALSGTLPAQQAIWEQEGLTGYSDPWSVESGETIRFMITSKEPEYQMQLVRLIHGDPNPNGPGFKVVEVPSVVNGRYPGRRQELHPGSYVTVPHSALLLPQSGFSLQAWVYPTLPEAGVQGILTKWSPGSQAGYGLFLDDAGRLAFWIGDGSGRVDRIHSRHPLPARRWTRVTAVFDAAEGRATLYQEPRRDWPMGDTREIVSSALQVRRPGNTTVPLLMGAAWTSSGVGKASAGSHFNGKIDGPRLLGVALQPDQLSESAGRQVPLSARLIARWDFSVDISSRRVRDNSGNRLDGQTVNMPARGMTGHRWTGAQTDFNKAPREYGAIHFHEDDLDDAEWEVDFEFKVPTDLASGVYAARIRAGEHEDTIPFFVTPRLGTSDARIGYLVPTFNYQAYANFNSGIPGLVATYDHHSDGSGVAYASRLRPMVDIRPTVAKEFSTTGEPYLRHLGADLYFVDWLEAKGHSYDVLTDHDLHQDGLARLSPYKVIVTGSHPEYWSEQMLNALQSYLEQGGRLMYLGGNGFYWVTSQSREQPHIIEVRRWGGTRLWSASPGEYHHSTTGELGGLWRARGRPPQKMVGVGFTAQGWTAQGQCGLNRPYTRQPGSFDPRASFIFEGIGDDETISGFPSLGLGPGAAGDELDRMDFRLGTPSHTLLLATATGFSEAYQPVVEEARSIHSQLTRIPNRRVRSDMIYFEYPNGGAVFSVGSISWFGSLSYNDYDNNVSRITENVLRRFASTGRDQE